MAMDRPDWLMDVDEDLIEEEHTYTPAQRYIRNVSHINGCKGQPCTCGYDSVVDAFLGTYAK